MWTLRSSYINTTLLYSFTATATTTATHQNEPMRVELIRRGSNLDKKTKKTDPLLTKCDQFRDKNCVWHFLASCQPLKFIKVYRKHVSCATRGNFSFLNYRTRILLGSILIFEISFPFSWRL